MGATSVIITVVDTEICSQVATTVANPAVAAESSTIAFPSVSVNTMEFESVPKSVLKDICALARGAPSISNSAIIEEVSTELALMLVGFAEIIRVVGTISTFIDIVNPAHAAISNFYRDFRNRMINLVFGEKKAVPESIEDVIETRQKQNPAEVSRGSTPAQARAVKTDSSKSSPQRYIYSDSNGELQFADSLQDVPEKFRKQAQPIGE